MHDLPHRQPRIGLLQLCRAVVKLVSKQDRHLLNVLRCDARFAVGDALLQLGNRLTMFLDSSTNYSSPIQLAGKSATVVIQLFDQQKELIFYGTSILVDRFDCDINLSS